MKIVVTTRLVPDVMTGKDSDVVAQFGVHVTDKPILTGTPKQVLYAETIRDASIESYVRMFGVQRAFGAFTMVKDDDKTRDTIAKLNEVCAKMADKLSKVTDAKTWIEIANGQKNASTVQKILARADIS